MAAFLLAGCGDDEPTKPQPPGPNPRPVLSSPQVVLNALETAYASRDTTGYMRLFDPGYQGRSFDPSDPFNPSRDFTWADEQGHIEALAKTATISSIILDFGPSLVRFSDVGDPPGFATIQLGGMNLEIYDGVDLYKVQPGASQEFKFRPTAPDSTSPTDTTWKIINWTEVAQ